MTTQTALTGKRIAILSPVAWRTPPRQYGAWETVASNIAEGLIARGWDVTLFATGDSITAGRLNSVVEKIKRLAIVSDNGLLSALPKFAAHLVHPDVKHFGESEYEDALSWLKSSVDSAAKKSKSVEPVGGDR